MGLLVLLSALWLKMSAYEIHVFLFHAKFLMSDVKVCSYVDKTLGVLHVFFVIEIFKIISLFQ